MFNFRRNQRDKIKFMENNLEEFLNTLRGKKKKNGGFFDLPNSKKCNHPDHEFPKMICIPKGKGYTHVCPACGNEITVIQPQVTLGMPFNFEKSKSLYNKELLGIN